MLKKLIFIGIACGLVGCQSLGLAPAQNTQQSIAYAYSGVTAALNTLAGAIGAGLISSADAEKVNGAILTVKSSLDEANAVASTNGASAASLLAGATKSLASISAYLTCKQQRSVSCQLSL